MKLIDPETNREYEFEEQVNHYNKDEWVSGTLKPVDSWPKDFYFIEAYGEVASTEKVWHSDGEWENKLAEFGNCFRTKQEALHARDRVKSLQEARVVMGLVIGEEVSATLILPKKYLKAWQELSNPKKGKR